MNWRKGWDSNPRYRCRHDGFQDRFHRPLGHPSRTEVIIPAWPLIWLPFFTSCTITLMAEGEIMNSENGSWQFSPETGSRADAVNPTATAIPPQGPEGSISWTASEFVAHHKSPGWYLGLTAAAIAGALLVWFVIHDKISAGVVLVAALFFGIFAARKPRQLQYRLDNNGLSIGEKKFPYRTFRSFALVPEGAFNSIEFLPLKRFSPLTTIYYDPADEAKIVALLADRLPLEHRQKSLIDRFMWRIRF